jgi:hypothetical protein
VTLILDKLGIDGRFRDAAELGCGLARSRPFRAFWRIGPSHSLALRFAHTALPRLEIRPRPEQISSQLLLLGFCPKRRGSFLDTTSCSAERASMIPRHSRDSHRIAAFFSQ